MSDFAAGSDPFDDSLWGEYARVLLIGTAACSAALWSLHLPSESTAIVMVVANVLVMGVAVSNRRAGLGRLAALLLLVFGVVAVMSAEQDPAIWWSPLLMFSPVVTIGALSVLVLRDVLIAMQKRSEPIRPGKIFVVTAILAASIYMIVIPGVDAFLEKFRERPQSYTVEDLSPWEILRVRSAKLAVFAIFAYAGASIGSFLNVVAASAPRGERIALRSSACPKCHTPIRRVDNLPIISYMRLRGRCRDCQASIPIRYFVVEVVGLSIFASLFLFELITGAANVPGFRHYHSAGIVWIILYTKWPVVGIYLFHCALLSCVLTLALMEQDRLRAPRWMAMTLPIVFAAFAIAFPAMLTVSLGDQTPLQFPATYPDWLDRAATCLTGGALGWAIGSFAKSIRLRRRQSSASLTPAFVLIGIALGWQAVLTIAVVWLVVMKLLTRVGGRSVRPRWMTATTMLFVIAMLHHPAWKWLAGRLSL